MFMVPIIIAAGAKVAYDMHTASSNNTRAANMSLKSLNRMGDALKAVSDEEKKASVAVQQLANRKLGILKTTIPRFIDVYSSLMKIQFRESDGINELTNYHDMEKNLDSMKNVCMAIKNTPSSDIEFIANMLSSSGGLLCVGAMTSACVSGTLLNGAATAVIANPLLFLTLSVSNAVSGSIVNDSKKELVAANMRKKYTNVIAAQAETNIEVLRAIYERANRLKILLTKLNIMFCKSLEVTEKIIIKNGNNRLLYSNEDKDYIRNCLNFADAVKSILDTPLYDENGQIAAISGEALNKGEEYLKYMEEIMVK